MGNEIQPHNERPAAVWSSGGSAYDRIAEVLPTRSSIAYCGSTRAGRYILDLAQAPLDHQVGRAARVSRNRRRHRRRFGRRRAEYC